MTTLREFNKTELAVSYGYIFWTGPRKGPVRIGFMRRPQIDSHSLAPLPWKMATVGGPRNKMDTREKGFGPNSSGFMGRPPHGLEIANEHLQLELGVKIDAEFYVPRLEGWLQVTCPFSHRAPSLDVRNVGLLMLMVRQLENTEMDILREGLAARNAKVAYDCVNDIVFFTQVEFHQNVLEGSHSLTRPETVLVRELYDVLAEKNQYYFQAEAHLAVAD